MRLTLYPKIWRKYFALCGKESNFALQSLENMKILAKYLAVFFTYVLAMALAKPIFLAIYGGDASATDYFSVLWHGLGMDMSIAGYLAALPTLGMLVELHVPARPYRVAEYIYYVLTSLVVAAALVVNIGLYGYWHFPLDMTPVFYFTSSPKLALASAPAWQSASGIFAILVNATAMVFAFRFGAMRIEPEHTRRLWPHALVVLLAAFLFLPIRGGVTVSTMNISHAYFSPREVLNHAAVNPAFSLMYSASHQADFGSQYRFMDDADAEEIVGRLNIDTGNAAADTLLSATRPDIYLIILESFSSHLFPSLGGEAVAERLDSLAGQGVLFTNIYASSFRTDRGLPAVLSALPGQPSTSLMKFADKASRLPSLASTLKENGYRTQYYYGGDANFTNMKAYLLAGGFDGIVSDKDFSLGEKASKWGAPDHLLFERALDDLRADTATTPLFATLQTSSSHEPFDVPFRSRHEQPELNAFAYADSCVAAFMGQAMAVRRGHSKLFVLVPDHQGAWPKEFAAPQDRHRVPVILYGDALSHKGLRIDAIGSQTDLAATLLAQLGIDYGRFPFSRDLLQASTPKWAFYSTPSYICLTDSASTAHIELATDSVVSGGHAEAQAARAYLQKLYDYLNAL